MDAPAANAMQRLARFVAHDAPLPDRVRRQASRVLVDTLAVAIAGSAERPIRLLEAAIAPSGDEAAVRVAWRPERYRAEDACLIFGTAAHVLDFDDVSMLAMCHPTAPVLTALYVLAQHASASGAEFLDALAIGTEVGIRGGEAMGFRHYALGFHATSTIGTLGAAAACARLLRLTPTQVSHALAIAASLSSGLRINFGTMVKSLHVGVAASNGLRAARLAQAGVEGAGNALEGGGWLHAYSGGETAQWPASVKPGEPFAIDEPGFEQKRYPCCYLTHKIIESTLALRRKHGLTLDGLERAEVVMPPGGTAPLNHPIPGNGLEAKFSGPYAVVAALEDGAINLASFEDTAAGRAKLQAACRAVTLTEAAGGSAHGSDIGSAPVTVTLAFAGGRTFTQTTTLSPGSAQDPLTDGDLQGKWRDCLARGLPRMPAERIDRLYHTGLALDAQRSAGRWLEQINQEEKT